jgi:hypothetical protein
MKQKDIRKYQFIIIVLTIIQSILIILYVKFWIDFYNESNSNTYNHLIIITSISFYSVLTLIIQYFIYDFRYEIKNIKEDKKNLLETKFYLLFQDLQDIREYVFQSSIASHEIGPKIVNVEEALLDYERYQHIYIDGIRT